MVSKPNNIELALGSCTHIMDRLSKAKKDDYKPSIFAQLEAARVEFDVIRQHLERAQQALGAPVEIPCRKDDPNGPHVYWGWTPDGRHGVEINHCGMCGREEAREG